MSFLNLISLLSGLAMFLYGISLMGEGLSKVSGGRLQKVLYRLDGNPIRGILLGIGVTVVIQSSSAASVMVIGFVNSGLMQLGEAISMILGSIVGTSMTGWIVSLSALGDGAGITALFSTTFITGALAIVGIVLYKFSKKPDQNHLGAFLLGLAVLMFGMNTMIGAVMPLKENESFLMLLSGLSRPLAGLITGIVFTVLLRSSAAAVGILQAVSMTGNLSFSSTYPILLGILVGGALPVLLSAKGASVNARRTAFSHLMIDVSGAVFCGLLFYVMHALRPFVFMEAAMSPVRVALLNTTIRILTALLLTPMIGILGRAACLIVKDIGPEKDGTEEPGDWDLLEDRFLSHPAIALEQSRIVLYSMAAHVRENLEKAIHLLHSYTEKEFEEVQDLEEMADHYEDRIGTYLVKVSSSELTKKQNEDLYQFLHAITDLERISDHATNISENAREIHDRKIDLSVYAIRELNVMQAAVQEVLDLSLRALTEQDEETAHMVEPLEEVIDTLSDEMRHRHIERLQKGICTLQHGFVFNDLVTNFERISDHCSNLAIAMIELEQDAFDTHDYVESLMGRKDEKFDRYYRHFSGKYSLDRDAEA